MKSTFHLVSIRGIPIGIHYSWFAIFFLVTLTLSQYVFPEFFSDWTAPAYWLVGLCTSLLFFASLLLHELAHSIVAVRSGIMVRGITLFIFGGAARISREADRPGTELFMATAGPLMSVALAGMFALVWWLSRNISEPIAAMGFYLCWINLALAVFNMLPGFPLDGGRVLHAVVWWRSGDVGRATRVATLGGQAFGCLLILGGVAIGVFVYWFSGIWLAFLGAFLYVAARASQRQATLREGLQDLTARDLMISDCRIAPPEMDLEKLDSEHFSAGGYSCVLVGGISGIAGVITKQDLKDVPRRRWQVTSAAEAMVPVGKIGVVRPEDDALSVLERMGDGSIEVLLVMSGGALVGVIERGHIQGIGRARWV